MDNFGGAAAWDRYCTRQDELLTYTMENTMCKDCLNYGEDGVCREAGEKVDPYDLASDIGCECVRPIKEIFYV